MSRFYELCADVNWIDYGGKWFARSHYYGGTEYTIVEFINWEEATGDKARLTDNPSRNYPNMYCGPHYDYPPGEYAYTAETTNIDLAWYTPDQIDHALDSMDMTRADLHKLPPHKRELVMIEAAKSYGYGDVVDIRYGNNARTLLRQAKQAAG